MNDFDIAIVGAGIVGCVIAREIVSRDPVVSVAVIDRDVVGSGATRRSAGLHFPRGSTPTVRDMAAYSQRYYATLLAAQPDLPIYPLDLTVIATDARAFEVTQTYLPEAGLRTIAQVRGLAGGVPVGSVAWRAEGCQYADVYELGQHIAKALRPRVELREGSRVCTVTPWPDGVELVLGTGETLRAGQVVLAPGPWLADPAWRDLVAPIGARVKKVVALHINCRPEPDDQVIVFHDDDAFLLPMAARDYWLYSYTCQEWDVDPDALTDGLTDRDLDTARASLSRHAPNLVPHIGGARVFCDAYALNREPVTRALDPDSRLVFAGACNGSGYRLAPAVAAHAVDLLRLGTLARSHS